MADELIEGKVAGWPCSIWIIRNPGEKGVSMTCAPYTDENDNSASQEIKTKLMEIEGDFKSAADALQFAKAHGFEPA